MDVQETYRLPQIDGSYWRFINKALLNDLCLPYVATTSKSALRGFEIMSIITSSETSGLGTILVGDSQRRDKSYRCTVPSE